MRILVMDTKLLCHGYDTCVYEDPGYCLSYWMPLPSSLTHIPYKGSLDGWKHTVCIVCVSHTLPSPIFGIYIAGILYERVEFTGEQREVQPKSPPCHACCRVNIGDSKGHPGYPSCWEGCVSYTNGFQGLGCLGSTCVHCPVPSNWEYWPMIECGSVVMHRWDTDGEHLQGKLVCHPSGCGGTRGPVLH